MSAVNLINKYGDTVTVTRYADGGEWIDGLFVAGPSSEIETIMSIQPLNGRELMNLPEAQRTRQMMKGYASIELFTSGQSAGKKADLITYQSKTYEVQSVEAWRSAASTIAPYWKVLLAEVNI